MHTPSTRILSALAYDRGEEYDPGLPPSAGLVEALSLVEHAAAVIGDDGPYERARLRRRERERERERPAIPDWFCADDLIAAPWETVADRFV
jgi:hypothetical protein